MATREKSGYTTDLVDTFTCNNWNLFTLPTIQQHLAQSIQISANMMRRLSMKLIKGRTIANDYMHSIFNVVQSIVAKKPVDRSLCDKSTKIGTHYRYHV